MHPTSAYDHNRPYSSASITAAVPPLSILFYSSRHHSHHLKQGIVMESPWDSSLDPPTSLRDLRWRGMETSSVATAMVDNGRWPYSEDPSVASTWRRLPIGDEQGGHQQQNDSLPISSNVGCVVRLFCRGSFWLEWEKAKLTPLKEKVKECLSWNTKDKVHLHWFNLRMTPQVCTGAIFFFYFHRSMTLSLYFIHQRTL